MKKIVFLILVVIVVSKIPSYVNASTNLEEDIIEAVRDNKVELSISEYQVTPEEALRVYFNLHTSNPDLAYADNNAKCIYKDGRALKLCMAYKIAPTEIEREKEAVNGEIERICSLCSGELADIDKVKIVYRHLIHSTVYSSNGEYATPYELLINKRGTCLSYAYSFKLIMDKLGIPSEIVSSRSMRHAWNIVKLGDSWYHIDLAYSNIDSNQLKEAVYANALKSDTYFKSVGYREWETTGNLICDNTRYDSLM